MAYADRISDLARTLAQYPTSVTITGSRIDIRTAKQLESLNAQISNDQSLARNGDTLIAAGSGKDAKALSQRIADAAPQVGNLLAAFGAQDAERLKTLSIMSKQKFDASAASRLQAEKRFADELSTLLTQEATAVAGLSKSESGKPEAKPDSIPEPKAEELVKPQPSTFPTLQDTITTLPGYLRSIIPEIVKKYDDTALSTQSKIYADAAIKLGANSNEAVRIYVVMAFTYGPEFLDPGTKIRWVNDIINNPQLGMIDQRILILRNAVEMRRKLDLPILDAA